MINRPNNPSASEVQVKLRGGPFARKIVLMSKDADSLSLPICVTDMASGTRYGGNAVYDRDGRFKRFEPFAS